MSRAASALEVLDFEISQIDGSANIINAERALRLAEVKLGLVALMDACGKLEFQKHRDGYLLRAGDLTAVVIALDFLRGGR
ncbi:hypothetical protein [Xanthomonas sp. 3498]|uniref:hypothetical protein n=1 Tax=Xanthomonas sp. 3498 TaxID=2663863 RepID=UPI001613A63A|nr:hypothetical protein [Xanthomonas sp. 3498]MBB5875855.1 ribonuclease PH [Xanthomonas sp. 3498]